MPAPTRTSSRPAAILGLALGLGVAMGLGCAAKSQDMAAAPNEASFAPPPPASEQARTDAAMDMPADEAEPDAAPDPMADLESYEQQLRDYEQRLTRAGVRLRTGLPGGGVPGETEKERQEARDRAERGKGGGGRTPGAKTKGSSKKSPRKNQGPAPSPSSPPSGDTVAGGSAGLDAEAAAAPSRCETVCSLQEAICGLQDRICGLAEEHPDEMRYAEGCLRARDDCAVASEACDGCEEP